MHTGKVIVIANQKGGAGKTTTAQAIGAGLMRDGKKVLFVDLDPQANLTATMRATLAKITVLDVLQGTPAARSITATDNGEIIAASPFLAGADRQITGADRLKKALQSIARQYDFFIIDTPPALGVLTVNALTAADYVIIPAQADAYSLQGIGQLMETIAEIKRTTNKALQVGGILITRYTGRAILSRDMAELLQETAAKYNTKVYAAPIREGIVCKEAQAMKQDIFTYAPKSKPAQDYAALIGEIKTEEKNNG